MNRERRINRRLIASLVVILSAVVATGCEVNSTPPVSAPTNVASASTGPPASSCTLEAAITKIVGADPEINCGLGAPAGICGDDCRDRVRACALESARSERPFVAMWTNEMIEGVGTKRALLSRDDGAGKLAFIWLDFTYASAFDPISGTVSNAKRRIVARKCFEIEDLSDACTGPVAPASRMCVPAIARGNLWLRCAADEQPFCAD